MSSRGGPKSPDPRYRQSVESGHGTTRGVVGSVVPSVNQVWTETLTEITGGEVISVGPDSGLPIELDVEEPLSVGSDRIVNTLAARELYRRDTIAVDLGTATTFDCITGEGVFCGGVISPGLKAGLEWLSTRTAKLPTVELKPPEIVIGRRTETCIQSGVFYQAIDAVDGIVRRIKEEWGAERVAELLADYLLSSGSELTGGVPGALK